MVCQAQEGGWGALCSVGMGPGAPVAGRGLLGGVQPPSPAALSGGDLGMHLQGRLPDSRRPS